MKNHPARKELRPKASAQPIATQQVIPLVEVIVSLQEGLRDLVISAGLQTLEALLEADRERLCGPLRKKREDRVAYRHGHESGRLVIGGRKVSVDKPRVRSTTNQELTLPSWEAFRQTDPLEARMIEQMLLGVATRGYERSLEALDQDHESIGVSKSSVSRRFVSGTSRRVEELLHRSLAEIDVQIIMIDGIVVGEHTILVVLGIDSTGAKHVLGICEGVSESENTCRSLFRSLIDRGLEVDRPRLFVIDGSRGLRAAIRSTFGSWALVQRCQVHKLRNVLDHLPERKREWVRAKMRKAWEAASESTARSQLQQLARSLEDDHPGAAASLREGLDETLTLMTLGVRGALYRTLRSTNPIENLNGTIRRLSRNVKRWRNGKMVVRWIATALQEGEKRFRKIKGVPDLPALLRALDRQVKQNSTAEEMIA